MKCRLPRHCTIQGRDQVCRRQALQAILKSIGWKKSKHCYIHSSVTQLFHIVETMTPCRDVTFLDEAQRKWHNGAIVLMEEVKVVMDLNDRIAMEVVDNKKVDVVDITFGIIWAKTFSIRRVPKLPIFSRVFLDYTELCLETASPHLQ